MFDVTIRGLQELQAAVLRSIAALQPSGAFGKAVRYVTLAAHRYATAHTVVDTGSWRAAHRPEVRGLSGRIYVDPAAANPHGGQPSVYGPTLELTRGGRYAVYARTVNDVGPQLLREGGKMIEDALP